MPLPSTVRIPFGFSRPPRALGITWALESLTGLMGSPVTMQLLRLLIRVSLAHILEPLIGTCNWKGKSLRNLQQAARWNIRFRDGEWQPELSLWARHTDIRRVRTRRPLLTQQN